tara:strand:- start:230 stop:457 length:228 start_codon:yes stop_codon:yes gene_type:complete
MLDKLYEMGLIPTKRSLVECEKITASAFARRRLPVVLMRLKFAENLRQAVQFVEHGEHCLVISLRVLDGRGKKNS